MQPQLFLIFPMHKFLSLFLVAALTFSASAAPPEVKRQAINVLRVASTVADGETITIGTVVFEVDTAADPGAITAGRVRVNCSAAVTAAEFTTQFAAAVNNANLTSLKVGATKISNSEVLVFSLVKNADVRACTETLAGTNNAWAAATLFGGSSLNDLERKVSILARAATATEAALETMHFVAPFAPAAVQVSVRTAAGVAKAWDGAVVVTGSRVDLNSSGSTDVASTDVVTLLLSQ